MCWDMVLGAGDRAQSEKGQSSVLKELRFQCRQSLNAEMNKQIDEKEGRKEGGKKEREKERISLWGLVSGWIIKLSDVIHIGGEGILLYFTFQAVSHAS